MKPRVSSLVSSIAALSLASFGCQGTLGSAMLSDAGTRADAVSTPSDAFVPLGTDAPFDDAAVLAPDAFVPPGVDAGVEMPDAFVVAEDDAAVVAMDDAFVPPMPMEMCPTGPTAARTYPATWAEGECIVRWSHDGSVTRARYWTSPDGSERVLYADREGNFCSAGFLGNLLGSVEGRWAALAFPQTPPWEGGRRQPEPDCARFMDGQHIATWSHDGSDIRARRSPSGVLYAENNSGGTYSFVPGHWVGAAGGTGVPNEDLCFAETMP